MTSSSALPPASSASLTSAGPRGVELLAIDDVELWQAQRAASADTAPALTSQLASGRLTALLVIIDVNDPQHSASTTDADVWLVLNIHNPQTGLDRPFPLLASQRVVVHRPSHSYRFISPPGEPDGAASESDIVLKLRPSNAQLGADTKTPFQLDPSEDAEFEDILAQYCAFEEPSSSVSAPPSFSQATSTAPALPPRDGQGEIELFDEHGNLIGHLEGTLDEHPSLKREALTGTRSDAKNPVLIDLSGGSASGGSSSGQLRVSPLHEGDAEAAKRAAGDQENVDWLVRSAHVIGRNLVKGSVFLGSKMNKAADAYVERNPSKHTSAATSRASSPFSTDEKSTGISRAQNEMAGSSGTSSAAPRYATTQTGDASRSHYLHKYSAHAVSISHTTTSAILNVASAVGDKVGKVTGIQRQPRPDGTLGPPPKGVRGLLNRGIIAASSLLDSIELAGEQILSDSGNAASKVIGHKYGPTAERRTGNVALATRNVYMIYKDVAGVRRRCLVRAVVGSSLKARTPEGDIVEVRLDGSNNTDPVEVAEKAVAAPPPASSGGR